MGLTHSHLKSVIQNGLGQGKLNNGPEFLTVKSLLLALVAFSFSQEIERGFGTSAPLWLLDFLSTRTE